MKKNLFLVAGIFFAFGSYAQVGSKMHMELAPQKMNGFANYHSFNAPKGVNNDFTAKAAGDTIYSEDFTDGSDWTFENAGQTGNAFGWALVSTSRTWGNPYGISKQINSNSGGKFLEVMNGAYNNGSPTSAVGIEYIATSPAIAITGKDYTINFQQYGALFNDSQIMEVSSDGTSWTQVFTNNNRGTYNGGDPTKIYGNPENIQVNLGLVDDSYLNDASTTLYIRFKFGSRFSGQTAPMAWITWGWMIDDIVITENNGNDAKITDPIISSEGVRYTIIPTDQAHTVGAFNTYVNNGKNDLTGVRSYVQITQPDASIIYDTLDMGDLAAYATDTVGHEVNLTDEGTYVISGFGVTADVDDDLTNNNSTYTYDFQYGGNIYAIDRGEANMNNYDYEQENAEFYLGTVFDMYADAELTGVDVYIATAGSSGQVKSTPGTEIYAQVRAYDNDFPILDQTELYSISASDNNKWTTLVFNDPFLLSAGETYMVSVGTFGSGDASGYDLVIGFSGDALRGSALAYYGSEVDWYIAGSGGAPMVRANFTPGLVSTKNLNESVKVNVYPNPANETAVVAYNTAFDGDVTISVVDMSGRTVYTNTFANQTAGQNKVELNVNDFNSGVYQVVIEANSSTVTKKLVVK